MAQIVGQIIYNWKNDPDETEGLYSNWNKNISISDQSRNIIDMVGCSKFTKMSIQAPPGYKIKITVDGHDKEIMIGRTGIYNMDENINITRLIFMPMGTLVKNETATNQKQISGITKIKQVLDSPLYASQISYTEENNEINHISGLTPTLWKELNENQTFSEGLTDYSLGTYGVFELGQEKQLENIMIDYMGVGQDAH